MRSCISIPSYLFFTDHDLPRASDFVQASSHDQRARWYRYAGTNSQPGRLLQKISMVVLVLHISWKDAKLTDVAPHGNPDVKVVSSHNSVDPDGQTPNTDPRSVHDDPNILALTNAGAERYEDEWNRQHVHEGHKREGRIHHLDS